MFSSSGSRAKIVFNNGITLESADIQHKGFEVWEYLNPDEDLTVGKALSAEIKASILNEHKLLSGFQFGEATVYASSPGMPVGANPAAGVGIVLGYGTEVPQRLFEAHPTEPYLTVDGVRPVGANPPFAPKSLVGTGNQVYAISEDGDVWHAFWIEDAGILASVNNGMTWTAAATSTWSELETETWENLSPYMELTLFQRHQAQRLAREGVSMVFSESTTWLFADQVYEFDFVPLGVFVIDKPSVTRDILISIEAYDRMLKFDVDGDTFWSNLAFPISYASLLSQLCAYVGVPLATTSFINSDKVLASAPIQLQGVTCREILCWIAEAACSYARMTRDGQLELAWFTDNSTVISAQSLSGAVLSEFQVAAIDKLQVKGVEKDVGVILGTGTNGYIILDNPLLYGNSDTEIRAKATPIFNRLIAVEPYTPFVATTAIGSGNLAMRPGEIVTIEAPDGTAKAPLFSQKIVWDGSARIQYETTGNPQRPVLDAVNRRVWAQDRAMYVLTTSVNGLNSEVSKKVGNTEIISRINQSPEAISIEAARINLNGAVTANQYFKINTDGSMEAISGQIGGFTIGTSALTANGFGLNANTGTLEFPNGAISTVGGILQIIGNGSGILLNGPVVQLGSGTQTIRINGSLYINGVSAAFPIAGQGACSYQWSSIPGAGSLGPGYALVASDAGSTGYSIKTRYSGGWQWCVDGASGSTTASWIAVAG